MKHESKMRVLVFVLVLLSVAQVAARAQGAEARPAEGSDERLAHVLERVGESVRRYQLGMFRIAFTEIFRREELKPDMTPKRSKEFVFDSVVLREELSAAEDDYLPRTVRRLKSIDGKTVKGTAAAAAGVEATFYGGSLNFLLPQGQRLFDFSFEGEGTLGGRRVLRVGMLRPGEGEPRVEWEGMSFRVLAPMRWLFWVDAESFDVLRVESHLAAPFEFDSPPAFSAGPFGRFGPSRKLRYAREDYSMNLRRVQFKDPEQTLLVPESAEWVTVIEGASRPRLRRSLRFANYRRFRSDVKVVEDPEPDE
ncbi:MAG: hypothetical protein QOJ76_1058 [Acidobacteriota bacterium]|jgi:hypothetical protein|nr:hypothetical protein [Acidobacteriota bacterium]